MSKAFSQGGYHKHPLYRKYRAMNQRCYDTNKSNYYSYGGRGIEVCEEWNKNNPKGFENFFCWAVGQWEEDKELDRINPDGDYCPQNCRFLSKEENRARARKPYHAPYIKKNQINLRL